MAKRRPGIRGVRWVHLREREGPEDPSEHLESG
jgi:hypothetical protein